VTSIDEGGLRFDFGDKWRVAKWDGCRTYADGIKKLNGELTETTGRRTEGTKAVDFVGVHDEQLYLCEVKDFRGYGIENRGRQIDELPLEVGLKVRDTLAGLVGAYASESKPPWLEDFGKVLMKGRRQIHVVAWIAEDPVRPNETRHKRNVRNSERGQQVKKRLAWLTRNVLVEDPLRSTVVPDVTVTSLPGAGR
jgi:hypothetical protein